MRDHDCFSWLPPPPTNVRVLSTWSAPSQTSSMNSTTHAPHGRRAAAASALAVAPYAVSTLLRHPLRERVVKRDCRRGGALPVASASSRASDREQHLAAGAANSCTPRRARGAVAAYMTRCRPRLAHEHVVERDQHRLRTCAAAQLLAGGAEAYPPRNIARPRPPRLASTSSARPAPSRRARPPARARGHAAHRDQHESGAPPQRDIVLDAELRSTANAGWPQADHFSGDAAALLSRSPLGLTSTCEKLPVSTRHR